MKRQLRTVHSGFFQSIQPARGVSLRSSVRYESFSGVAAHPKVNQVLDEETDSVFERITHTQTQSKTRRLYNGIAIKKNAHDAEKNELSNNVDSQSLLVDSFGRMHNYLRISLTEKCNLRCRYCMPEEGIPLAPKSEMLTTEEIVFLSKLFIDQGVSKIRLTGGEPLVRRDIVELCAEIGKQKGLEDLCITTNGILLERKLDGLIDAGVNRINISLDTLVKPKFEFITRRKGFERVKQVIEKAAISDLDSVKVNCVVKRRFNDNELIDFVHWTQDLPVEVRFIEYMPFDGNRWNPDAVVPYYEMVDTIRKSYPDFGRQRNQDGANPTSKTWRVPGFKGSVGFISSMSKHFCGSCNRLRITADGNLKACLFGSHEVSLRDLMREQSADVDSVLKGISESVGKKHRSLGGYDTPEDIAKAENNREMIRIGG